MNDMDEEYRRYRIDQAHAYLERIRRMGESCAGLRELVEDARERATGVRGIDYSDDVVSKSPSADAIPNAVIEIRERIADYVTALAEYEDERYRANRSITEMDDATLATALRLRYLLGWTWESVCVKMGYTWDGMMKLRRRALCDYYDVMPCEYRDARPVAYQDDSD